MNAANARKIRLFYGIGLGVFTVVIAILFIIQVTDIYFADVGPLEPHYSREIVGKHLMNILVPCILWIVAVIAGYVLSVIFPYTEGKKKPASTAHTALNRLKKRIPQGTSEEFLTEKKNYNRLEILRIAAWSVSAVFAALSAVIVIVYLANPNHFPAVDFNAEVIAMVKNILPWICVSFVLFIGATLFEHFSAKYELESVKKLLVLGKGAPVVQSALLAKKDAALAAASKPVVRNGVRIAVFIVAVSFIVVGLLDGGWSETLSKAIAICTECIGLG